MNYHQQKGVVFLVKDHKLCLIVILKLGVVMIVLNFFLISLVLGTILGVSWRLFENYLEKKCVKNLNKY